MLCPMRLLTVSEPARRNWERGWLALLTLILFIRFTINFTRHPPFLMDFEVYRGVALTLLRGDAAMLYHPATSEAMVFKYAPVWALGWLPLGLLSNHLGAILGSALTVLWITLTLWLGGRLCRRYGLRYPALAPAAALLLVTRFLNEEFLNGQTNSLWGFLTMGAVYALSLNRRWLGSLALALAISLKLPTLIFLPYLLIRRQWDALWRTVGLLLLINFVGAWLLTPQHPFLLFGDWFRVLASSGPSRAFEIGSQSFLALLGRFLTDDGYQLNLLHLSRSSVVVIAGIAQAALFGLVCLPVPRPVQPLRFLLDAAILMVFMALFSPTCWLATYCVLLCPILVAHALLVTRWSATSRNPILIAAALVAVACSTFTHYKFWRMIGITAIATEKYTYLVVMMAPWFALGLAAFLIGQRFLATSLPPSTRTGGAPRST